MPTTTPLSMGWFCPTLGDTSAFADPSKTFPQSLEHFERVTVAAENAGFDYMLVPVSPFCWDAWMVASYMLARTQKIKALVAIKPGYFHPVAHAKMVTALDQLSNGRVYLNLIAGISEKDAVAEGQYGSKEERYAQLEEEVAADEAAVDRGRRRARRQVLPDQRPAHHSADFPAPSPALLPGRWFGAGRRDFRAALGSAPLLGRLPGAHRRGDQADACTRRQVRP